MDRLFLSFKKICLVTVLTAVALSLSGKEANNAFNCTWELMVKKGISFEDARLYSLPGKKMESACKLVLNNGMADIGKSAPGFVPAESTAVVRGVFESPANSG